MQINWYGHSCFRLRSRKGTVITDPYGDGIGYTVPRVRADIVTVSHDHPNHANVKAIKGKPRIVSGPGEYEIKDIFIIGIPMPTNARKGENEERNVIYMFDFDGITVCHLGDLRRVPTQAQVEELTDVDVLLVPVGGGTTIGAAKALDMISLLEPKIVIPMHYRTEALKGVKLHSVDPFLKEMGAKGIEPQDLVKVTKGGLPAETQLVVMSYGG